jgi:TolA-binding protein
VDKQYAQAIKYYSDAAENNSTDQDYAYLQLAVVNGIDGNIAAALRGYEQLLREFPRSRYYDDAVYQRAQLNFENGSFEESIRGFSRLMREKPRSQFVPYAYLKRGTAYYNLQDYDRCIEDYQALLNDYPTHPATGEVLLPMQEVLNLTNRSDEFAPYLAAYKRANPDKENVEALEFETAKNFYYNLEYQKSIDAFDDYIRTYADDPKVPEARYLMAESHYRLGQLAEAKTLYEGLLGETQLSQYNRIITRLATIEASSGDMNDAISRYQQLAAGANNKKELYNAWAGLMEGYYVLARYDSSRYYARQILEKAQVNVAAENKAHLYIGKSEMGMGNNESAIQEFRQTRDNARDQSGAEAQFLIGKIQYLEGRFDESIESLIGMNKDFGSYQNWVGESYLLLADNYVAKDDYFQAKATLNSIIENFPDAQIKTKASEKLSLIQAMEEQGQDEVIIESDSIDIID